MKKYALLLGLVFVTLIVLASCGPKGGTIEVKNGYAVLGVSTPISVTVGTLGKSSTKEIPAGRTEKWTFDEDGAYTVTAVIPPFVETVTLSGGNTKTVTIK